MTETGLTNGARITTFARMMKRTVMGLALASGGCVNVTAPDKPIEINLNISVTQQVVYRLDNSAKDLINSNPGIF